VCGLSVEDVEGLISYSVRDGGDFGGRLRGGLSRTAWNHAGSFFMYPPRINLETC
jgi:hypothetical protein